MLDLTIDSLANNHFIPLIKNIFAFGSVAALVAIIVTPLQFLKIMRQQTGWTYSYIFHHEKKLYGPSVFYRALIPYVAMSFLINAAFGISEHFSVKFLHLFLIENTFWGMIFRALAAGLLETIFTIRAEVIEITKNKIDLMKTKGTIISILVPAFLRNTIAWLGALLSLYFILKFNISFYNGMIIAFIIGLIISILSLPFDVITTQNCGDIQKLSVIQRMKKIIKERGYKGAYAGSLMRIIQITLFTIGTTISELILHH